MIVIYAGCERVKSLDVTGDTHNMINFQHAGPGQLQKGDLAHEPSGASKCCQPACSTCLATR